MAIELIFRRPPPSGSPVELVFGDDGEAGAGQDAVAQAAIRLPGARVAVRVLRRKTAAAAIRLPGARVALGAVYQTRTDRPAVGGTLSGFEEAASARAALVSAYQQSAVAAGITRIAGQPAMAASAATVHRWQDSARVHLATRHGMGNALAVAGITAQAWQEGLRVRLATRQGMSSALFSQAAVLQRYQEAIRVRSATWQAFGDGQGAGSSHASSLRDALLLGVAMGGTRYQNAMVPPPGITPGWPVDPPKPPPCYVPPPGGAVELVFSQAWAGGTELIFLCCKGDAPNPESPRYVIPLLRVYMTVHSIDAVLLPSLERVPLQSISITTNDDEYGWTMSASGKLSLLDQLAPQQGVPQQIRVTIDGIQWVFVVDPPARTRKFPEHTVQVTGRSVTSLLGAPYFSSTDWASSIPQSAQQLVLQALDLTGVGLDWRLDDWLVPANIWSHSGTPLSVAQRIAEAAGGVVRSHRTEPQLQIAPRFPHMPWAWGDAVPDVRMPAQIITSDSLQSIHAARYNAVYVAGTGQGLPLGHVVRAGTAGDRLAPQVTDALITDIVAARLRGQSVLAASAITHQQPITVPLLTGSTNPGLILPGYLIEVQEPAETWRGLVRGITVSVDAPAVRQTLDVERAIA